MRVLIYGGRTWRDQERMNAELDRLHAEYGFRLVINGCQVSKDLQACELFGADWQALVWARIRGVKTRMFYAHWHGYGRSAGPIRNRRMLVEGRPELGVQFPGGKGTRNMRGLLDKAGIPVIEIAAEMSEVSREKETARSGANPSGQAKD